MSKPIVILGAILLRSAMANLLLGFEPARYLGTQGYPAGGWPSHGGKHRINNSPCTGVPSAIGSRLAAPAREVVCVTGDGAAGFNFMEMQSAAREGLKVTTVVFAEGSWTMEEPNELMIYGRTFGTAMGTVRWDLVAEWLGCHGYHVERREELAAAIEKARSAEGPAVVCVKTDREANLGVPEDMIAKFMEVYQGPMG